MFHAFEMEMVPRTYECGPDRRLRANDLMKHLQEAASRHADILGFGMEWMTRQNTAWVLVDMRLGIKRMPSWREQCTIYTMPSGHDGLRAYREFLISGKDDEELLKATSVWMVMDTASKIPRSIRDLRLDLPEKRERNFEEMGRPGLPSDNGRGIHTIKVGQSSIDMNGHVNNTEYIRWSMDALSSIKGPDHLSGTVHMSFREEVFTGDLIEISEVKVNGGYCILLRKNGGRKVSFAMLNGDVWFR